MKKVDVNLKVFLSEFGLSEREIVLYLALLKTGPNTIMNLSRETGIKRSTTHNNVEELIKKGLVSQTNYGERRMVVAEPPEKLKFLIEQKKWGVKKMEEGLPEVVGLINSMVPEAQENTQVEVKYYNDKKGVLSIYSDAFTSKELRSYVNLGKVSSVFPENADLYIQTKKNSNNTQVKEIIDSSAESIKKAKEFMKESNFEFKISSEQMNLSAVDVLIYDGHVAMINFNDDDKISGTVIANNDYYENSKAIFNLLWDTLSSTNLA